jgi:hypothetical protein
VRRGSDAQKSVPLIRTLLSNGASVTLGLEQDIAIGPPIDRRFLLSTRTKKKPTPPTLLLKKFLTLLALFAAGSSFLHAQEALFDLGFPAFDIQVDQGSFTQTSTGIEWSGDMQAGDLVGGFFPMALDLSAYTTAPWQFGIAMVISGENPNVSFTGEFFDSNFNSAVYSGSTPNIVNGFALLDFESLSPGFDYTEVVGFQITWGGTGFESATVVTATSVAAVPEPGVVGLVLFGLGVCALRRSRAKRED